MTATLYLEEYIDTIESLPNELLRNFTLLSELDATTQAKASAIEAKTEKLLNEVAKMNEEEKESFLSELKTELTESIQKAEEKVALATQTYEMVDRHIRRLDEDLARFDEEYMNQVAPETETLAPTDHFGSARDGKKRKNLPIDRPIPVQNMNSPKIKSKKQKDTDMSGQSAQPKKARPESPSLNDMMTVDPNEPTYCLCHRVSFGEMIACDSQDCPTEWFHYECVGLKQPPKGKWYCSDCAERRKKGLVK